MIGLFGRNPLVTALVGVTLIVVGLAGHRTLMPWIGAALLVVGGVKAAIGTRAGGSSGRDRFRR